MKRLLLLLPLVLGCHDTGPVIKTANDVRKIGHAADEVIEAVCKRPAREALEEEVTPEEAEEVKRRLEAIRCPQAFRAQDALKKAHEGLHLYVKAVEAGKCLQLAESPLECDIFAVTERVLDAAGDLALLVEELKEADDPYYEGGE